MKSIFIKFIANTLGFFSRIENIKYLCIKIECSDKKCNSNFEGFFQSSFKFNHKLLVETVKQLIAEATESKIKDKTNTHNVGSIYFELIHRITH